MVVDNLADTEEEAFDMIKRFLSYLPDNVWQMPPRMETSDDPSRMQAGHGSLDSSLEFFP